MKRYYISHPFTGSEEKNKADADRIRAALKEAYPDICFMNPLGMFGNKDTDYCTALADALELLSSCDAVIFCRGWEDSAGCRAEKAFAMQQGIKIMYIQDFRTEMRRMEDEEVKQDLAQALKSEIVQHEADMATVKGKRGELLYYGPYDAMPIGYKPDNTTEIL